MLNTLWFIGLVSAYSMWPTIRTVEYHQELGNLPAGNIDSDYILVAVNDCGLIGEVGQLWIDGKLQDEPVMVFDCLGGNGEHSWMSESNSDTPWKVAIELGYNDWIAHPEWVGTGALAIVEFDR